MSAEQRPSVSTEQPSTPKEKGRFRKFVESNAISFPAIAIGLATWPSLFALGAFGVGAHFEIKSWRELFKRKEQNASQVKPTAQRRLATV